MLNHIEFSAISLKLAKSLETVLLYVSQTNLHSMVVIELHEFLFCISAC